jgi:capsular polysaccharide transport system ATP-binding protein
VIYFEGVTKQQGDGPKPTLIVSGVTAAIPTDRHIALLTPSRLATKVFLDLLANITSPNQGRIERSAKISFPVGRLPGFSSALSVRMNIAYVARLYGADVRRVLSKVERHKLFGALLDVPFARLGKRQRIHLAAVLPFYIPFDFYVMPQLPPTLSTDKVSARVFYKRMRRAGSILPVSARRRATHHCDMALLLVKGKLLAFETVSEGFTAYDEVFGKRSKPDADSSDQ